MYLLGDNILSELGWILQEGRIGLDQVLDLFVHARLRKHDS
jgi:hypothetical protein